MKHRRVLHETLRSSWRCPGQGRRSGPRSFYFGVKQRVRVNNKADLRVRSTRQAWSTSVEAFSERGFEAHTHRPPAQKSARHHDKLHGVRNLSWLKTVSQHSTSLKRGAQGGQAGRQALKAGRGERTREAPKASKRAPEAGRHPRPAGDRDRHTPHTHHARTHHTHAVGQAPEAANRPRQAATHGRRAPKAGKHPDR